MELELKTGWVERWSSIDLQSSKTWAEQLAKMYYDQTVDGLLNPRFSRQSDAVSRAKMVEAIGKQKAEEVPVLPPGFGERTNFVMETYVSDLLDVMPECARTVLERIPVVAFPGIRDVGTGCRVNPDRTKAFICVDAGYLGFLSRATSLSFVFAFKSSYPAFDERRWVAAVVDNCAQMLEGNPTPADDSFSVEWPMESSQSFLSKALLDSQLRFILAHEYSHILCDHFERAPRTEPPNRPITRLTANDLENARVAQRHEIEADRLALRLCNAVADAGRGLATKLRVPGVGIPLLFLNLGLLGIVGRKVVYRSRDPQFRDEFFSKLFVGSHPFPLFRLRNLAGDIFPKITDMESRLYNTYLKAWTDGLELIAPGSLDAGRESRGAPDVRSEAASLSDQGEALVQSGEYNRAANALTNALNTQRKLVEDGHDEVRIDLSRTLDRVGVLHAKTGHPTMALAAGQEAVTLLRSLTTDGSDTHRAALARSLVNLSSHLWQAGRAGDGVAPLREAITYFRELTKSGLIEYLPTLAAALDELGIVLALAGRPEEALKCADESVKSRRRLVEQDRPTYSSDLARSLHNRGCTYAALDRRVEAVSDFEESIQHRRALAKEGRLPAVADLAESYGALGKLELDVGNHALALNWFSKGLDVFQPHLERSETMLSPPLSYVVRGYLIAASKCRDQSTEINPARLVFVAELGKKLGLLPS